MVMRAALLGVLLSGAAFAQDAALPDSPPLVAAEAPVLPASPVTDPVAALPSLPAGLIGSTPVSQGTAAPVAETDLISIIWSAHWVVQTVMVASAVALFVVLTVLVYKSVEYALAGRRLSRVTRVVAASATLPDAVQALSGEHSAAVDMVRAATAELALAQADPALLRGTGARTQAVLARIEAGAALVLRGGTGVLASIGSLAPFVGLFGTVFGIMNSFLAIAETKTTNLAVVAPGIAEALLANAIGLAAAIPAVLIYNIMSRRLAAYRHRMADLAAAVQTLQSRALDRLSTLPSTPQPVAAFPPARAVGGA
jgi:biopolymer transport protein ExbB